MTKIIRAVYNDDIISNKNMQEQDLQQIGDLLDKKLDEKLDLKFKEENNKKFFLKLYFY